MGVIMGVSLMMIMVMVYIAVVMLVAVVPEFGFVEQEEK